MILDGCVVSNVAGITKTLSARCSKIHKFRPGKANQVKSSWCVQVRLNGPARYPWNERNPIWAISTDVFQFHLQDLSSKHAVEFAASRDDAWGLPTIVRSKIQLSSAPNVIPSSDSFYSAYDNPRTEWSPISWQFASVRLFNDKHGRRDSIYTSRPVLPTLSLTVSLAFAKQVWSFPCGAYRGWPFRVQVLPRESKME